MGARAGDGWMRAKTGDGRGRGQVGWMGARVRVDGSEERNRLEPGRGMDGWG